MCQFSAAIQKFSQRLNSLGQELTDFVEVLLVSAERCKQSANEDGAMLKTLKFWYTTWTDQPCDLALKVALL